MISLNANYIKNYFRIAFLNIKSNLSGNIFASSIMSFSFFIMLFFLLCYINIYNYMNIFRQNNVMIVFLKSGANQDGIVKYIKNIKGVKSAAYYDSGSSMKFLEKRIKHIKSALNNIDPSYLPVFIKVKFDRNVTDKIFLSNIYLKLKLLDGVRLVYYNKMLENKIGQFMFFTKVIGLILFMFLFILAIFISYSAIKLVILRKQYEIEILKLLGATNGYIRTPMLIEGQIETILSFLVAVTLLFGIYKIFMYYRFDSFLEYFHIKIIFLDFNQIIIIFIIAVISGLTGTYLSSRRFF